jgi:hypothetical protein
MTCGLGNRRSIQLSYGSEKSGENQDTKTPFDECYPQQSLTKSTDGVNTGEQRKTASYGRTPSLFLHSHRDFQLALFLRSGCPNE